MNTLTNEQIEQLGLADWRKLAQALHARFLAADSREATAFIAAMAATLGRLPEIRLIGETVDLAVCTVHDGRWVTSEDAETAQKISQLAHQHGLRADPGSVTQLEIALDTAHESAAGRFWSALLTGDESNTVYDSVFDPAGRVPVLWFQQSEDGETPRQRWHFDVWLAAETADERIAASIAAGGTIVDQTGAPAYIVLADPEGNRVCICTSRGRE